MSLPVFPTLPGLTFTSVKSAEFNTLEQKAPNAYSVDIPQTINPVWHFALTYDFLRDFPNGDYVTVSELRTLMGFFNGRCGKSGRFLFTDPDDYYVGPAMVSGVPNAPLAQLQVASDGVGNFYSPIQRTLDGVTYEDITDLNGSIAVYVNGTLATSGTGAGQYTLLGPGLALPGQSYMGMYLKWGAGAASWQAGHAYALNATIVDPAGHVQKATTGGTSGASIPTFSETGGTTNDPSFVVWTDQGSPAWAGTTAYALGAVILDGSGHIQQVTTAGTSGSSTPTFSITGGTTTDGTVTWTDRGTPAWSASTYYFAGSLIIDGSSHIQKATGAGLSGGSTPTFSTTGGTVNDPTGSVVWTDQGAYAGPTGPITWEGNFYFRVKFESDSQDFEKFMGIGNAAARAGQGGGWWTVGGSESQQSSGSLKLETARPVPL